LGLWAGVPAGAQAVDAPALAQVFHRTGQKNGAVVKFGFPRTDLHAQLQGVILKPGLALGSWAAFEPAGSEAMMMGDLVLQPEEVTPVLRRLRARGIEVTAIHNHLLFEAPRLIYMHYVGTGTAVKLAQDLEYALQASRTPLGPVAPAAAAKPPAELTAFERALGQSGSFAGGVLSLGIPRADTVKMGATTLPPAMGVAESINLQEAGAGRVASTGDFVLQAQEVEPVLDALLAHGFTLTALHTHMLGEQPQLYFLHFWDVAPPAAVAAGVKAALAHIAVAR